MHSLRVLIPLLFLLFSWTNAESDNSANPASLSTRPYFVPLASHFGAGPNCSSTLIKPRWLLTMASCLEQRGLNLSAVTFFKHPRFDIALIRLPVEGTKNVPPEASVQLPKPYGERTFVGKPVEMCGYGRYKPSVRSAFRCIDLKLYNCSTHDGTRICAASEADSTAGPCDGDRGGPLTTKKDDGSLVLLGVISYDFMGCSSSKIPEESSFYTNVAYFWDWIDKTTKNEN